VVLSLPDVAHSATRIAAIGHSDYSFPERHMASQRIRSIYSLSALLNGQQADTKRTTKH
jgi:hypothetical protein